MQVLPMENIAQSELDGLFKLALLFNFGRLNAKTNKTLLKNRTISTKIVDERIKNAVDNFRVAPVAQ